jgi:hypothetical protein
MFLMGTSFVCAGEEAGAIRVANNGSLAGRWVGHTHPVLIGSQPPPLMVAGASKLLAIVETLDMT